MLIAIDAVGIRGHGGEVVLRDLLDWFPRIRPEWHWHVFLLERRYREFDDPIVSPSVTIENTKYGNKGFARLRWVYQILPSKIKALNADVIFSFANIGSSRPASPQIIYIHQPLAFFPNEIYSFGDKIRFHFLRYFIFQGAKGSHIVVVQTNAMRKRLLELNPALADRTYVIPCGYRIPSRNPIIRPEKKKLIDGATHPRLIYISYPHEHKNHTTLLRALPEIIRSFPKVSLLLTLETTYPTNLRFASVVHEIIKISKREGMGKHLVMLGNLNKDEVDYALTHADLQVFPSLAESVGLGLVEGLSNGCPMAASNLSFARDVADEAAVYFDPYDPKDIARTVVSILHDTKSLNSLKAAAAKQKLKFSDEQSAKMLADLMEMAKRNSL